MAVENLRDIRAELELPKLPGRARLLDASKALAEAGAGLVDDRTVGVLGRIDVAYRTLCSILYNYVPLSGHPGGSISSGTFVEALLYTGMDYDIGDPLCDSADQIVYAAGHKAMGLYAMWALRDEMVRLAKPDLLPSDERRRLPRRWGSPWARWTSSPRIRRGCT